MNIEALHQLFLESSGVCTDTRKITRNCIFFALKGANFNGNSFASEAIDKGAKIAIIDEQASYVEGKTWFCNNALKALQELAHFHRNHLSLPIISLTGSNGKTTTKELIHKILSKKFQCVATKGNLNNHIGVPLTLLSMNEQTEIGIVEMGANHQGEIDTLSKIAAPNFGYITNFGKAHLEGFGGVEGVIKGKSELYRFLKNSGGKVFVNANDSKQMELTQGMDRILIQKEVTLKEASHGLLLEWQGMEIQTQLIGTYNLSNLSAAISIGNYFEVDKTAIKEALETYSPQMNRSQVVEKKGYKIILDAYNANPTSMKAALKNLKNNQAINKIAILGDMFELGEEASKEHQHIVRYLEEIGFQEVFLVGSHFYHTDVLGPNIFRFKSYEDFQEYLSKNSLPKGLILIKGSRGMALERVLPFL